MTGVTPQIAQAREAEKSDTHQVATELDSWKATEGSTEIQGSDIITDGKLTLKSANLGQIQGLPVAGYKKTQPPHLIALVNENKRLEEIVLRQIEAHKARGAELDQRCVALAFTAIQDAFMWLNRGVFQPERLTGDLN